MCKTHVFIERFFTETNLHMPECIHKLGFHSESWANQVHISKRTRPANRVGQIMIRYSQTTLYKIYTYHLKTFYPGSRVVNMNTFLNQLVDIGVNVQSKRQRINTSTSRVLDFFWTDFYEKFSDRYGTAPAEWATENPEHFRNMVEDLKTLSS